MPTIQERAMISVLGGYPIEHIRNWSSPIGPHDQAEIRGYIKGATDMLEKAVQWLNDNKVRDDIVGYFLDTQREEMREEFILEFKKEMEE